MEVDEENWHEHGTGGIIIKFPYIPYPSQEQMMDCLVQAANEKENCLLESPTGTGKTLTLLCSLLTWRSEVQKGVLPQPREILCTCQFHRQDTTDENISVDYEYYTNDQDLDFFAPRTISRVKITSNKSHRTSEEELEETRKLAELCIGCHKLLLNNHGVPTIFYASRTHSQLTQVVSELKQKLSRITEYKKTPITVLSSRKMTCINPDVSEDPDLNKLCLKLHKQCATVNRVEIQDGIQENIEVKVSPCQYIFEKFQELEQKFERQQREAISDIEDLKRFGRSEKLCPYYGAKSIVHTSAVVFLPYIYLINPFLRHMSNLNEYLDNSIIVFDEAHNIENVCREVFTYKGFLSSYNLDRQQRAIETLLQNIRPGNVDAQREQPQQAQIADIGDEMGILQKYHQIITNLKTQLQTNPNDRPENNDPTKEYQIQTWTGEQITEWFTNFNLGKEDLQTLKDDENILQKKNKSNDITSASTDHEITIMKCWKKLTKFVKSLSRILQMLYTEDNILHFAMVLKKVPFTRQQLEFLEKKLTEVETGTGKKPKLGTNLDPKFNFVLDLYCLNPAIAFRRIKETARSIILASGTLTPTSSFASELNTEFQHTRTFPHPIASNRVFSRIISSLPGYSNGAVRFTYEYLGGPNGPELISYLGKFIASICEIVPYGVLVFVSSYGLLDKFFHQWEEEGILARFRETKSLFRENSGESVAQFKSTMSQYREKIRAGHGCLLFGVFRGKISEGVDFSDNQARAVIPVGIPFSNANDDATTLKKVYNNERAQENRNFLDGWRWYEAQAYRALNQGVGRAIRHPRDWGIILFVDERIRNINLSEWVRNLIGSDWGDIRETIERIGEFVRERNQDENNLVAVNQQINMEVHLEEEEEEADIDEDLSDDD